MAGTLQLDESGFPLIVATFRGHVTPDVLAAYFAKVDAWCSNRRRYAAVLDISCTDVPSAAERKRVAEGMAARDAGISRFCAGTAIVLTSALLRGAVTAVLWMHPMKHPHALVATRQEGKALCVEWLAEAQVSIPG
jgi:hypothetical protein